MRRRTRAFTLVETLFSMGSVMLVLYGILSLTWHSVTSLDRRQLESGIGNGSRTGVDEMLSQLRYASVVLPSQAVSGATYTTGSSSIVILSQGYDPSTSTVFLSGVSDYTAFRYDSTTNQLLETCSPGTGSVRPSRTSMRIANNVTSLSFTYRATNEFTASSAGSATYTLSASATSAPMVLINGAAGTGTWSTATPNQITVTAPSGKADIQVVYPVNPTANSGAALQYVKQVDVTVGFAGTDSRSILRTLSMAGTARLRNQRQ